MASSSYCGTGTWGNLPKPGDPSFNSVLSAKAAFGGIDVWWSYPDSNPHAVAHTRLYRSLSGTDEYPVLHTIVNGNFFYDKIEGTRNVEYFYWIQFVSINGTEGGMIGPVSAVANPPIADVIAGLTASIDQGHLAQSLKTEVGKISTNKLEIDQALLDQASTDDALAASIEELVAYSDNTRAMVQEEILARTSADEAFVGTVNTIQTTMDTEVSQLSAAIQTEQQARVDADEAMALQLTTVQSEVNDDIASVQQRMETQLKSAGTWANSFEAGEEFDSWVAQAGSITPETTEVWGGEQAALVRGGGASPTASGTTGAVYAAIPAARNILYSGRRIRVSFRAKRLVTTASNEFAVAYSTNADGNSGWHRFNPTTTWEQYSFLYDVPHLSGQRDHYIGVWGDTSGGNGGVWVDAMFITPVANEEDLPGFGAMYSAKVDVNGLIGGFGLYNDGDIVDAGFDVDRFWVGRTNTDKVKPFIIVGGKTYIDEAVINQLTFDKLRSADGSLIVANGAVKAQYLDAENLVVRQGQSSNYVPGTSGWALNTTGGELNEDVTFRGQVEFSQVTGAGSLASKDSLDYGEIVGTKPPSDADKTSSNTAYDTARVSGTAATTIKDYAINGNNANNRTIGWVRPNTTLINGNKIYTGDAYVDTLQIKGQAVTIPVAYTSMGATRPTYTKSWGTVATINGYSPEGGRALLTASFKVIYSNSNSGSGNVSVSSTVSARILRNGSTFKNLGVIYVDKVTGFDYVTANGEQYITIGVDLGSFSGSYNFALQVYYDDVKDVSSRFMQILGVKR